MFSFHKILQLHTDTHTTHSHSCVQMIEYVLIIQNLPENNFQKY